MSEYNKTILTNQGLDLMARANKGTARFAITRAATSTEQLANKSMADLQQLTELPSLMQYGVINNVADSTQDKSIVIGTELLFNNKDLGNGYNINTIGLFAKEDGQDKEILYAITTAIAPEFMPDYKNKVLFKFSLTMFVAVGRTDNVSVIVDDSNSATKADLTKVKKELDGKVNVSDVYNKTEINEKLDQVGKLKKISVNGGTPVEPDAGGVANIVLPDLNHPDYTITTSPFDLDLAINLGIYRLNGVDLTTSKRVDALTALPSTAIKGAKGFLIQKKYDDYYNMQILVLYDMPNNTDITWSFRCIGIGTSDYRDTFKRITTDIDYTTLLNQVNQKANTNDVYTKFQTDNRLSLKANASDVYTQSQIDNKLASISVGGDIDAINRKLADKANAGDVYSKSQADSKFGGVKKVNGKSPTNGNISVPMYAPNLLKGTSEQTKNIPPNASTDVIHLTTDANTKYTVAVDIDYTAFSSGSAGAKLQVNNGGGLVDSTIVTAGSKERVSVTFTTPDSCYWVTILLTSNSSYTGKYGCLKASKWQDTDIPPDMTWVPAIEDYRADLATLSGKIDELKNRETYHLSSDLSSGLAYSNSHPNVFVGTP
ncbi:hypothetical protein F5ESL0236_04670 [Lactobacillus sp. ESL0236]|uniref:hypothetical protein n=1 Tax=unclassified Lactobacillus TaxID=2620435 RepID=UPI000EFD604C|nr:MULTISPECIES: hypothetical protein [unclassified Lactobacillus]RMC39553.1 hypothetical protein F5ESL0237_04660 [Lactobacillus sp. ESL0237]RMC43617.1 hypothetical protein F5ESL0234_04665 [Lactobacillus sp. ESL0234]RMC45099.1 hypothetical protein F5ESL0236_04670 [Lactobacillus sp. ESL0236]